MRTMLTIAAAITASAAAAAPAPQPVFGGDAANTLTPDKLVWASAPSAADVAAAYPKRALAKGRSGRALLHCRVEADGVLKACKVLGEDPDGQGFGAAALSLAPKFRFIMATVDPKVVGRMAVNLPVAFTPPGGARTLDQPDWLRTLPPDKVQEVFPPKAADAGLNTGRAVLDCTANAQGLMTGCQVVEEDPAGMEFGAAAIRVASVMSVNPWTAEGEPADGAHVRFALRLNRSNP